MQFFIIIPIAVGLAMDTFAVSIVTGSAYKQLRIAHAFRMASFFGGFQAFMPLIGALAGTQLTGLIGAWDHWVAFALLAGIGSKMIYESFKIGGSNSRFHPSDLKMLVMLSIATSIDALALGITLPLLKVPMLIAAAIIGLITFGLSFAGVYIGKQVGHFFERKIEALGGLILIGLGIKILFEHVYR